MRRIFRHGNSSTNSTIPSAVFRWYPLTDLRDRVNPNTGTVPIFRTRRDAELTTAIYGRLPVLVDRSSGEEVQAWPVKYTRMFDMTNDSGLFRTRAELEELEGAYPVFGGNRFAQSLLETGCRSMKARWYRRLQPPLRECSSSIPEKHQRTRGQSEPAKQESATLQ